MAIVPFTFSEGLTQGISRMFTKYEGGSAEVNGIWRYDGSTAELIYEGAGDMIEKSHHFFKIQIKNYPAAAVDGDGNPVYYRYKLSDGDVVSEVVKGFLTSVDDTSGNGGNACVQRYTSNNSFSLFGVTSMSGDISTPSGLKSYVSNIGSEVYIQRRTRESLNQISEFMRGDIFSLPADGENAKFSAYAGVNWPSNYQPTGVTTEYWFMVKPTSETSSFPTGNAGDVNPL